MSAVASKAPRKASPLRPVHRPSDVKRHCYHDCRWLYRRRRSRSGSIRRYTNANTFSSGLEAMRLTAPDMALHCMCSPSQSHPPSLQCTSFVSWTTEEVLQWRNRCIICTSLVGFASFDRSRAQEAGNPHDEHCNATNSVGL